MATNFNLAHPPWISYFHTSQLPLDRLSHRLDRPWVHPLSSRHDPLVIPECPPNPEVQRFTMHVGADASALVDEETPGGVVPYLLVVVFAAGVFGRYPEAKED